MRLLYFHAEWCGVCHARAPIARAVADERGLSLEVLDVDTSSGAAVAERLRIRTVPTLALVDGDRVRFRLIGRMISPENAAFLLSRI